MSTDPAALLNELAEVQAAAALTRADYEDKRRAILATVQADLDALDVEYGPLFAIAEDRATELAAAIKTAVLSAGASVKGATLHAVFTRGRESWDGKALAGYAVAHPDVLAFQKIGEPSVSIRSVK